MTIYTCAYCRRTLRHAHEEVVDGVTWFTCPHCPRDPQPHTTPAALWHVRALANAHRDRTGIVHTPKRFCSVEGCIEFAMPGTHQRCAAHGAAIPWAIPKEIER